MALTRAQIQTAFQNSLGRAASASDENSYFSVSQSGALTDAQIFTTISNSREADQVADPVIRFYQAAFGRVPDQAGLQNAENYVRANGPSAATYQMLSNMFAQSQEFTNRFGTGTAVDAAYVQALYSTILGRAASSGEVDGYVNSAGITRGSALYLVSQSQEAISVSDAAVNGFQNNAAQGTAVYSGTLYTAANGQPNTPGTGGQTFALTTGIDTLTGTAGNDTFVGTVDGSTSGGTSNLGDSINGGAGTDTVRIISNQTVTTIPTLTNVENLVIVDTVQESRDVSGITGLTSFTLEGGTTIAAGTVTATVGANQSLTLRNILDGNAGADGGNQGGVVIASAAGVTALALNVDGVGAQTGLTALNDLDIDISGTGVATLNLGSNGINNISLTDTGTALRTINITGSGATTITEAPVGITTVNASAATGAVNYNAAINGVTSAAFAFTGGSANDTLTLADDAFTVLATGAQLNGGAGTADKIGIFDTVLTGAEVAKLNAVTGFEVLGLNASITTDASALTTFKAFSIDTAGTTDVLSNIQTGTSVAFTASTTQLTLSPSTGVNSVDTSLAGGVTVGTLVTTGLTNVSIASTGTTANEITALTNSDNSAITITGSQALTVNLAAGTSSGSLVNGSAATGALTIGGSGQNDVIRGGTGNDVITGGAGADTLTGNAGNDTFTFASAAVTKGAAFTAGDTTTANIDKITDFAGNGAAAGDGIQLDAVVGANFTNLATATVTAVTVATAADFTTLTAGVQAASAGVVSTTTAAQVYDVTVTAGNLAGRYVIVNDGTTAAIQATDLIVSITGTTGALNAQDFTFV